MLSRTAIDIPVPEISGLFSSATCFKTIGCLLPRDKLSLPEKYPALFPRRFSKSSLDKCTLLSLISKDRVLTREETLFNKKDVTLDKNVAFDEETK